MGEARSCESGATQCRELQRWARFHFIFRSVSSRDGRLVSVRPGARAEECRGKGPATVNRASLFRKQKAKERPAGVTGGFQAAGV